MGGKYRNRKRVKKEISDRMPCIIRKETESDADNDDLMNWRKNCHCLDHVSARVFDYTSKSARNLKKYSRIYCSEAITIRHLAQTYK